MDAGTGAEQQQPQTTESGPTSQATEGEEEENDEPIPLYIPSCLSAPIVKLLVKQGVEAATKFKDHFKIKAVAPSELQQQLATAKYKLSQLLTLDEAEFATELEVARAERTTLEDRLGTAADLDGMSVDHAPGMETGLLSKMTSILSRHQKAMAREEEEHQQLILGLEAQVAELQMQISTAQRQHLLQSATNEELLVGLQTKVDALTTAPPPT